MEKEIRTGNYNLSMKNDIQYNLYEHSFYNGNVA